MPDESVKLNDRVALITGAAHRIGAAIARELHNAGMRLVLHYRESAAAATALKAELEAARPDSVSLVRADLIDNDSLQPLAAAAHDTWGRLDLLINNASTFYPTPFDSVTTAQWDDLLGTNLRAPFFLSQAVAPWLRENGGAIVNLVDIHADRPLPGHPAYNIAKAGLVMLTKTLAVELGPEVRVNAVAPGAILWPEHGMSDAMREKIVTATLLKRQGSPEDIARTVLFLVRDADYMSGQVLTVDGGRSVPI